MLKKKEHVRVKVNTIILCLGKEIMGLVRLGTREAFNIYNKVYADVDQNYIKFINDSADNEKFYEGGKQQWTPDELEAQSERGQYTMTMNIVKKAIDSMVGMFTASSLVLYAYRLKMVMKVLQVLLVS